MSSPDRHSTFISPAHHGEPVIFHTDSPMKKLRRITLLSVLLLNSCISTVHQYAARRALTADEVLVLRTPIQELRQVDHKFYARGYLGKGRGIQRGIPINSVLYQSPEYGFELTDEHPHEVFIELYHDRPWQETAKPERFRATAHYLTTLPSTAKTIILDRAFVPNAASEAISTPCSDSHKYYAYPLAAILAIGIDLPASIVMTAALIPTMGIGAACAKIDAACSQSQNVSTPPLSDKPAAVSDQGR